MANDNRNQQTYSLKQKRDPFLMKQFMREALRSGSIAAIAMIPFALLFSMAGMRINEYGKKTIHFFLEIFLPVSGLLCL